ncbi:hypothetical protein, partial [Xenorhabdus bovienii]|uniref:hypothetical protein n=1 Tax=Xenorhabdus bovienii TaxID=40576 RepID=UPI0023B26393
HFPLARKMPTIATDRPSEKLHLLGESKKYKYFIIFRCQFPNENNNINNLAERVLICVFYFIILNLKNKV